VADIFRRTLDTYKHKYVLGPTCDRIARDVMACRTAVLGGHLEICTACGFQRPAYNSCRNRHCPKCQALRGARWVEARLERILPVHYFHVVFTLPSDLHELARRNRARVFDLLLKSAAGALLTLGRDPKWFGLPAQLGVTTVLHTWARDLHFHPHAHCIVTGGGLAPDGKTWVGAPQDFLLPVHVLGALFRGKFLDGIERLRTRGLLSDHLDDRSARRRRARLYDQSWVVYAKRPFGGAEQVYRYLGRYTHRVAISNARLVSVDDDAIVFRTRGPDTATVAPVEFIRRFLDHRLPKGFVKIRHGGLLSPTNVNGRLALAKTLLSRCDPCAPHAKTAIDERSESKIADLPWPDLLLALTGLDLKICPACHGRTLARLPLPPDCRGPPTDRLLN
jgi:Putative transposase/Transposase zinc-binding domain